MSDDPSRPYTHSDFIRAIFRGNVNRKPDSDEIKRRELWLHLTSSHEGIWDTEASLEELVGDHVEEHHHPGPGMNHDPLSRDWTPTNLVKVLLERVESPSSLGVSQEDSPTDRQGV